MITDWIAVRICPFQYTSCTLQTTRTCQTVVYVPDVQEWVKQAVSARLCEFKGVDMAKKDYVLHRRKLNRAELGYKNESGQLPTDAIKPE